MFFALGKMGSIHIKPVNFQRGKMYLGKPTENTIRNSTNGPAIRDKVVLVMLRPETFSKKIEVALFVGYHTTANMYSIQGHLWDSFGTYSSAECLSDKWYYVELEAVAFGNESYVPPNEL